MDKETLEKFGLSSKDMETAARRERLEKLIGKEAAGHYEEIFQLHTSKLGREPDLKKRAVLHTLLLEYGLAAHLAIAGVYCMPGLEPLAYLALKTMFDRLVKTAAETDLNKLDLRGSGGKGASPRMR
jgi:hypothetical protein